ncbi:response regulator [Patescibacteria group bacterium]|nr:response regulator [Patescibacteria group bacterium]MBU1703425.1 response regulator [Patescibacteria group bacterium]MBU1953506.1 response regulator [Patescibacteria group bacterium]
MEKKGKKIVVAEDDKFMAKVYREKLRDEGFEVEIAFDGVEAVDKITKNKPSLVILDMIMPKKTGFDVLKEIKANPETKDIPVIILSNLGQASDFDKGKKLGAIDYIIKGDESFKSVMEKIKKHLA